MDALPVAGSVDEVGLDPAGNWCQDNLVAFDSAAVLAVELQVTEGVVVLAKGPHLRAHPVAKQIPALVQRQHRRRILSCQNFLDWHLVRLDYTFTVKQQHVTRQNNNIFAEHI